VFFEKDYGKEGVIEELEASSNELSFRAIRFGRIKNEHKFLLFLVVYRNALRISASIQSQNFEFYP